MIITEEKRKEFEELGKPLIKFLNDNFHPHVTVVVTPTGIELLEGVCASPVTEFVKD
jgi:hypothetical protein